MKLKILHQARYKIAAVMDGDECETENFLSNLEKQHAASAEGIVALIDHIAENGLDHLSSKLSHYVDKDEKIYELIKGDIRLLYFKGNCDLLVIATHGFIKKTQHTPEKEKNRAIKYKKQYQKAHDNRQIELVESTEGDEDGD